MNKTDERPRRNAKNDLSELVRILDALTVEDFDSLYRLIDNYQHSTSSLRTVRLLLDALAASKTNRSKR